MPTHPADFVPQTDICKSENHWLSRNLGRGDHHRANSREILKLSHPVLSRIPFGPCAAAFVKVRRWSTHVEITLMLLTPQVPDLRTQLRVLGDKRLPLEDSNGMPIPDIVIDMTEWRESPALTCVLDAFSYMFSHRMSLMKGNVELSLEAFDNMQFLGIIAGHDGVDWRSNDSACVLEVRKAALLSSDCEVGAGFLMLTRGDAEYRLSFLRRNDSRLQSDREDAQNVLVEIYDKLMSGDIQLMTFELEE